MDVIDLSANLDLIAEEHEHHGHHTHTEGIDPHIWLSPDLVKQMSEKITHVLIELNPGEAAKYKTNYLEFAKEIDELDARIRRTLDPYEGRKIIVFHPSLTYYARDYGLVQLSLESGGKEPTPQHMTGLVKVAKEEGIQTIDIKSEFNRDHARVFAEEIEGEIVQISPLDPDWSENLLELTQRIIDNL